MNYTHFKGNLTHLGGIFPIVGASATPFHLVAMDLSEISLNDYDGHRIILNIFPSLDTDVCALSVRQFNAKAAEFENTVVLCVSMDLPFAASRFCSVNGIENVITASAFRSPIFGTDYGVKILDGPLCGLLARAVIVIGADRHIQYAQLVKEITTEPNYDAVLKALQ